MIQFFVRYTILKVVFITVVFIPMLRLPVFFALRNLRSNTPLVSSIFNSKYSTMTTNNHKKVDSIIQYWFGNEEKSVQWRIWFPRKEDQPVVDKYDF